MKNASLAAALLLTALPLSAHAEPSVQRVSHVQVRHSDLDLTRSEDAQRMLTRIERAARRACAPAPRGITELAVQQTFNACVQDAVSGAVAALNAPRVTARHAERTNVTLISQR